jgi:hypothetical protein
LGKPSKDPKTWTHGAGAHEQEFMNFSSRGVWCRSIVSKLAKQVQEWGIVGYAPMHILKEF